MSIQNTALFLQHTEAEIVNLIHEEINFIESECADLLTKDFRGTGKTHYFKTVITADGTEAKKRVEAFIQDNRNRWELMNDLYWQQTIQFPLMMKEAG